VGWLLLIGLGIVWAAFLFPTKQRRGSPYAIEEFERNMGLLADTERATGRWIVAPRKDVRFMGGDERARCRTIARRRRFFVILLEALGLTFLMGLFPPLRGMWIATVVITALLAAYVWILLQAKQEEGEGPQIAREPMSAPTEASRAAVPVEARPRRSEPGPYGEYGQLAEDDLVHVVVYRSGELQAINA